MGYELDRRGYPVLTFRADSKGLSQRQSASVALHDGAAIKRTLTEGGFHFGCSCGWDSGNDATMPDAAAHVMHAHTDFPEWR